MSSILYIDTTKRESIQVGLEINHRKYVEIHDSARVVAHELLGFIDDMLHKHKITVRQISEIRVALGPGSFTGLRVGLAVSNMISVLLHIPINGHSSGTVLVPQYTE